MLGCGASGNASRFVPSVSLNATFPTGAAVCFHRSQRATPRKSDQAEILRKDGKDCMGLARSKPPD